MRNLSNYHGTVYHSATTPVQENKRSQGSHGSHEPTAQELRAQADTLERCDNPADTLCYSRFPAHIAEPMRARDVALLRARAAQMEADDAKSDLEFFLSERQTGLIKTQAVALALAQRDARAYWRVYEDAEDALRAAEME